MSRVRLADATDPSSTARQAFHAVAASVYTSQPQGTAPDRESTERGLSRTEFEGRQRAYVALAGDTPVGRVVARVSPVLRDAHGRPVGMLGIFECADDRAAADALFREAVAWLRQRGAGRIVGPMDGDTWHRYRVNIGPYLRPPFPLEPWNPPYYQALWEGCGFTPVESYSSKWIRDVRALLPGLESSLRRSEQHGLRVRTMRHDHVRDELALVHHLSTRIFADAFLYSPIPLEEFLALYAGVARMLDPGLVLFAETRDGEAVGFVFAYGDPQRPAVHYKTIGVLPEWRRPGGAGALAHYVYSAALERGRPQGNHALMRDDNRSQALDQGLGEVFRRYLLYEWTGA